MTKQNNKSTPTSHRQQVADKKPLIYGGVIVLLIAVTPFIFYSYKSFPEGNLWETFLFEWETAYGSWFNTAWYVTSKIVPLLLLSIWFFTCKHWWHWIILVPLFMYAFQLWNILNVTNSMDEVELLYLFPFMMVLIPFVYLIRAKLFSKIRGNDLKAFEEELGQKRTIGDQIKDLFR